MEEIFIAIMERIAGKMPELSYIDEDYGQLEAGAEEDSYPVTFPCADRKHRIGLERPRVRGYRKASHSSPYAWPSTVTTTRTTLQVPMIK